MDEFRFRPLVVRLEDRLTPASPVELANAIAQINGTPALLQGMAERMHEPWGVYDKPFYTVFFPAIAQANRNAATVLSQHVAALQGATAADPATAVFLGPQIVQAHTTAVRGHYNAVQAEMLGVAVGAPIPASWLPPPPPAPPAPPPVSRDDSGMTDTIPSLDAPEWQARENRLRTWDVVEGQGEAVEPGDRVTVHYTGWLTDGTQFDSSRPRGEPSTFSLDAVIEGWQQGIPGMKPGGIRRLDIPSALAYGPSGNPPSIPPNARLIFEVKLIEIAPPE